MDRKKDSQIDFEEFEETVKHTFDQSCGTSDIPWLKHCLIDLGKACQDSDGLREGFKKFGIKKTQNMTFTGWTKFLDELNTAKPEFSEIERHKLFSYLKTVGSDDIITFDDLEVAFLEISSSTRTENPTTFQTSFGAN